MTARPPRQLPRVSVPLLVTALALAAAPCATADPASPGVDLSGKWQSSDYECPQGVKHTEQVRITHDGTYISAVKLQGDECVGTGHESFNGTVTGNSGKVRSWIGAAGMQPILSSEGDLKILDANTFTVNCPGNNIKLTRVTTPN